MKQSISILALLLFVFSGSYSFLFSAPVADSCLRLVGWPYGSGIGDPPPGWNKDSVKVDECPGSPTFGDLYSRKGFRLSFTPNFYPFDHILDSNEIKSVSEIDSAHLGLLNRFLDLQDTFGLIYFQGNPEGNSSDSIEYAHPKIRMFFADYQDISYIKEHFKTTIDSIVDIRFLSYPVLPASVRDDESLQSSIELYPNPVKNILLIKNQFTAKDNDRMELFSVDGKRILETAYQEKLDVSMLHSGSYFLRINNQTIKFIKE